MTIAAAGHLDKIEQLMNAAWPAPDVVDVDGWLLRSAGGVTQRANSVWPVSAPSDTAAALASTTRWYADRHQPVIFQLSHRAENVALEALLDQQSYSKQSQTLIMTATAALRSADEATHPTPSKSTITMTTAPTQDWLELWWSVDGRGGPQEMAMAHSILVAATALYATAHDDEGRAVGTGRLAMPQLGKPAGSEAWGGIYSMAVHPQARRRGIATQILNALTAAGTERGLRNYWLMVTAANDGAQELYGRAGFAEQGRYHYRQAPLRRALGAC